MDQAVGRKLGNEGVGDIAKPNNPRIEAQVSVALRLQPQWTMSAGAVKEAKGYIQGSSLQAQ